MPWDESGKDIVVSNAGLMVVSELKPQWLTEVQESYNGDAWIEGLKKRIDKNKAIIRSQPQERIAQTRQRARR